MSSPEPAWTISVKQEPEDLLDTGTVSVKQKHEDLDTGTVSIKHEPGDLLDTRTVSVKPKPEDLQDTRTVSVKPKPEDLQDTRTVSIKREPEDLLDITKSIWIVGSSLVARAYPRAYQTLGKNLRLPADISWFGTEGMCWRDVIPKLKKELATQPPPDVLVLHVGGNDLAMTPRLKLLKKIKQDMFWLQSTCPNTKIVYSGIAARQQWRGARKPTKINKARVWINMEITAFISRLNGAVIHHKHIKNVDAKLFLHDGVHFTELGNDIFIGDLHYGLKGCL